MTIGGGKHEIPFGLHQNRYDIANENLIIGNKNDGLVYTQRLENRQVD